MNPEMEGPFDSIESAYECVTLLAATIADAKRECAADIAREEANPSRRLNALRLVLYNLEKVALNTKRSGRLLNDLRTLRRLLFDEPSGVPAPSTSIKSEDPQPVGRGIADEDGR